MGKTFKSISKYGVDDAVGFGKYLGLGNTWGKIAESDPEYVFWVVANTDKPLGRDVLVLAIKAQQAAKQIKIAAKKNTVDYDRAAYVPRASTPDIGSSTFFKHHGDSFMGTHSDDWDDDVLFNSDVGLV